MSPTSTPLGIGVIGGRSTVAELAILPAIRASPKVRLAAIASVGGPLKEPWAAAGVSSYEAVIEHPDVEAVYIPLPNGLHALWAERCAQAGKHVLCEKPIARTAAEAALMASVATAQNTLLVEAWMTPFDARWSEALNIARRGDLGAIHRIDTSFTFTLGPAHTNNYRWDPQHGGGALLDVGIYCLGPAVELWGSQPSKIQAAMTQTAGGVDHTTAATLVWDEARSATIRCSFAEPERQLLQIDGDCGTLKIHRGAHTGGESRSEISLVTDVEGSKTLTTDVNNPYAEMLEAFADSVRRTRAWPRPIQRSVEMLQLIDQIRAATDPVDHRLQ
ncbi:MAG: Gfo/Idh/MocA family oxidoreductase [Acidimicrobiales bacterium]|nr:Gfo/Idh/MocA family oxidoreductase [Acidimicrobiales bacterium]